MADDKKLTLSIKPKPNNKVPVAPRLQPIHSNIISENNLAFPTFLMDKSLIERQEQINLDASSYSKMYYDKLKQFNHLAKIDTLMDRVKQIIIISRPDLADKFGNDGKLLDPLMEKWRLELAEILGINSDSLDNGLLSIKTIKL